MRRILAIALAVAAVAVAGGALAAPALADQSGVQILGPVRIDGNRATVTARYNCDNSEHLFVSAKQVGDRSKDDRLAQPGSSAVVAQTNGGWWQSHPTAFVCDGDTHIGTFTIGGTDLEYGIGELQGGKAWIQFCLSYGDGETEVIEFIETGWVQVIGG